MFGLSEASELSVSGSVSIERPDSEDPIINGLRLARILHVTRLPGETLSTSGVTICNGNAASDGGGLFVDGGTTSVNLNDVVFDGRFAAGNGGGLATLGPDAARLSINDSMFIMQLKFCGQSKVPEQTAISIWSSSDTEWAR